MSQLKGRGLNLVGQVFNRLTVIRQNGQDKFGQKLWLCVCSCKREKQCNVRGNALRRKTVQSCGCLSIEVARVLHTTHGMSKTGLFTVWHMMIQRCFNEKHRHFASYGGRGITVCERWRNSFENFFADMGERPTGLTLDRINNDGNYEPGNCRWANRLSQANNRRNNHLVTHNGVTQTISQWARIKKMNKVTLKDRLKLGWTVDAALNTPVRCFAKR